MRAPLKIGKYGPGVGAFLYSIVKVSIPHVNQMQIRFLVDTGAIFTTLGERDALAMGIPFNKLGIPRTVHGIGGAVYGYPLDNVELGFRDEKGEIVVEKLSTIYVLRATKRDEKAREISLAAPSLIGTDFLKGKGYKFVSDFNRVAYLEK